MNKKSILTSIIQYSIVSNTYQQETLYEERFGQHES